MECGRWGPELEAIASSLTPSLGAWHGGLRDHPDSEFVRCVTEGLQHGLRISFDHSTSLRSACHNMPSTAEHPEVVGRYVADEAASGRILGILDSQGPYPGKMAAHHRPVPPGRV